MDSYVFYHSQEADCEEALVYSLPIQLVPIMSRSFPAYEVSSAAYDVGVEWLLGAA